MTFADKMTQWQQGPCECTNDCGVCMFTWCCPCFAFCEAAKNIGESDGKAAAYCLLTFPCALGCCVLGFLADDVAKKRGVEEDMACACVKSFFNVCTCFSCTVVNESRLYKLEGAKKETTEKGVEEVTMERN